MTRITCLEAAERIIRENELPEINAANVEEYFETHATILEDTVFEYTRSLSNDERYNVWMTCDDSLDWNGGISFYGSDANKSQMLEGFAGWATYLTLKQLILKRAGLSHVAV